MKILYFFPLLFSILRVDVLLRRVIKRNSNTRRLVRKKKFLVFTGQIDGSGGQERGEEEEWRRSQKLHEERKQKASGWKLNKKVQSRGGGGGGQPAVVNWNSVRHSALIYTISTRVEIGVWPECVFVGCLWRSRFEFIDSLIACNAWLGEKLLMKKKKAKSRTIVNRKKSRIIIRKTVHRNGNEMMG